MKLINFLVLVIVLATIAFITYDMTEHQLPDGTMGKDCVHATKPFVKLCGEWH